MVKKLVELLLFLSQLLLASGLFAQSAFHPQGPQINSVQKVIATRQTQFPIPFKITSRPDAPIQEVELAYSIDKGQNWYSYQKIAPELGKFQFYAQQDAEYWFIFRVINAQGEAKLAEQKVPTLRVLVDTQPPKLELEAKRGTSGEVILNWDIDDVSLVSGTPDIFLSYDLNTTWIKLAVDPGKMTQNGTARNGQTVFQPPTGTTSVNIRCEIADTSGNKEIKTAKLDLTRESSDSTIVQHSVQGTSATPVLPPRPTLKSETLSKSGTPSAGILPDLFIGEFSAPKNAELQPRYASETPETLSVDKNSGAGLLDLELPTLEAMKGATAGSPIEKGASITPPIPVLASSEMKVGSQTLSPPQASSDPFAQITVETPKNSASQTPATASAVPVPVPVPVEAAPVFPGKIGAISLKESLHPQLVLRWVVGETVLSESRIDIYRSSMKQGPWKPVAIDLKNTGEYTWDVSEEELSPFYLRVDFRSTQGLYTDITNTEVNILNAVKPKVK